MQKLLNVVQEFTAWCGMQINVKKTYLLVINHDKKRREQEPALLLTINGDTLQAMNLNLDNDVRRVQISGILGHGRRRYDSDQGSGQAKNHCST